MIMSCALPHQLTYHLKVPHAQQLPYTQEPLGDHTAALDHVLDYLRRARSTKISQEVLPAAPLCPHQHQRGYMCLNLISTVGYFMQKLPFVLLLAML